MPRIQDSYIDCVVYLYGSLSDAKAGEHEGGSGFLVYVRFQENPEWVEMYVVTNQHVVKKAPKPVVRMNRNDGAVEYFDTGKDSWIYHPDGTDVAVLPLTTFHWEYLKFRPIGIDYFITNELMKKEDVGIGDDTFMIGRFISHEGKQQNTPAIRFGNIAMMPGEKIVPEEGLAQESFLVETRSLPGYSGSPVFLYSTHAMMDFSRRNLEEEMNLLRQKERKRLNVGPDHKFLLDPGLVAGTRPKGPYLLGIDWCHLRTTEKVREKTGEPISEQWVVRTNSGMAGVIPAWKIRELLDSDEVAELRKIDDKSITKQKRESAVDLD